ncbi:hypothetical protein Pmani_038787, partial [Petrolisthes manimaculis]
YELQVSVSDQLWGQKGVGANVTVVVKDLPPDALTHAAPLTLTPTTPEQLTRGWTPEGGGGGLGRVIEGVKAVLGDAHEVEVVSVQARPPPTSPRTIPPSTRGGGGGGRGRGGASTEETDLTAAEAPPSPPAASVWVSAREMKADRYMDQVKLRGLLALHAKQLEAVTNLRVMSESVAGVGGVGGGDGVGGDQELSGRPMDPPSAASRPSTSLPLQVVDTNSTSLVTPRLSRPHRCHAPQHPTCTPTSCLNGGRCVAGDRCVCPWGSWGSRCKVLARTFTGGDWAWVRPLPPCLPTTISLRVLTRRPHALLLYSGPLASFPRGQNEPPTPMLALQLREGRPQVVVEGVGTAVSLQVKSDVSDGDWHSLHLRISHQGVALVVDLCGGRRTHNNNNNNNRTASTTTTFTTTYNPDDHCATHATWNHVGGLPQWPLQVGGLAHVPPSPKHHGWRSSLEHQPLEGCVSHLRLNGQLVDLGEPAYTSTSSSEGQAGCRPQKKACVEGCGVRGQCTGGLNHPRCECEGGWEGVGCSTPTHKATLTPASYVKLELPPPLVPASLPLTVRSSLRLRTRGAGSGVLLSLASRAHSNTFTLQLRSGVACASVSGGGWTGRTACVEGQPVGDGSWHTLTAEVHGRSLVVALDDGDGWHRNESIPALQSNPHQHQHHHQQEDQGTFTDAFLSSLHTPDGDYSVTLGGVGARTCVDDVRVWDRQLPLPSTDNGTNWGGKVSSWHHLTPGCTAPDPCLNTTCVAPLACVTNWDTASCSCGPGRHLAGHTCRDVDECVWRPCLHGGTCHNLTPGFQCVCVQGYTGDHCQYPNPATSASPLTLPLAVTALTLSILVLAVVVGVVVWVWLRRVWAARSGNERTGKGGKGVGMTTGKVEDGEDDGGGGGGCGGTLGDTALETLAIKELPLPHQQHKASSKEEGGGATKQQLLVTTSATGGVKGGGGPGGGGGGGGGGKTWPDPLPVRDDLRAYAYEGDGSSAGSLSSALSGLREEPPDEANIRPLVSDFLEVMDLLRHLPEAAPTTSPSLALRKMTITAGGGGGTGGGGGIGGGGEANPPPSLTESKQQTDPNIKDQSVKENKHMSESKLKETNWREPNLRTTESVE